jgi:hypothetical protein
MVLDHQGEHGSQYAAIRSIAAKIGCSGETLRNWVRQAERDRGLRARPTTDEREPGRGNRSGHEGHCSGPGDLAAAARHHPRGNHPRSHARRRDRAARARDRRLIRGRLLHLVAPPPAARACALPALRPDGAEGTPPSRLVGLSPGRDACHAAISAAVLAGLASALGLVLRTGDRAAARVEEMERSGRAVAAMARDIRHLARLRWSGAARRSFVFSGEPDRILFARWTRDADGFPAAEVVVLQSLATDAGGRLLKATAPLPTGRRDPLRPARRPGRGGLSAGPR